MCVCVFTNECANFPVCVFLHRTSTCTPTAWLPLPTCVSVCVCLCTCVCVCTNGCANFPVCVFLHRTSTCTPTAWLPLPTCRPSSQTSTRSWPRRLSGRVLTSCNSSACISVVRASAHGAMDRRIDPSLSYLSFQPVLHDWCNKGCGMCYPVCGMVHIKEPLLLIGKSSPCGSSRFPLMLS